MKAAGALAMVSKEANGQQRIPDNYNSLIVRDPGLRGRDI
jgi:hypothetical protein